MRAVASRRRRVRFFLGVLARYVCAHVCGGSVWGVSISLNVNVLCFFFFKMMGWRERAGREHMGTAVFVFCSHHTTPSLSHHARALSAVTLTLSHTPPARPRNPPPGTFKRKRKPGRDPPQNYHHGGKQTCESGVASHVVGLQGENRGREGIRRPRTASAGRRRSRRRPWRHPPHLPGRPPGSPGGLPTPSALHRP